MGNFDDPDVGVTDSYSQGEGSSTIDTWDSSSSYSSDITSEANNMVSLSAELDIPLDPVSLGLSASVSYTNDSTTSEETKMTYDQQSSQTNESSWLATAAISNITKKKSWPNSMTVYLDPRFNTLMFRVPPPAITSVSTATVGSKTNFTIIDDPSVAPNTTLGSGELDVFVCPHGSITGCQVDQDQVLAADGNKHLSTSPNAGIEVISSFKSKNLPKGPIDVIVSSPGGLSGVYTT